jgi:hypothetical protein
MYSYRARIWPSGQSRTGTQFNFINILTRVIKRVPYSYGRGFGLVVRAACWHAGDPGSILGMDGLYTFGYILAL